MPLENTVDISEARADDLANQYVDKYPDQMSAYESGSIVTRCNESLSPFEMIAVGQTLDQYNNYQRYVNESFGGLGQLGVIPQVALDVITAAQANSILPLLASTQPMPEEHGIVYYKQIQAAQNGGGYNKGDVLTSPLARNNLGDGTLGMNRRQVTIGTGDATAKSFSADLGATGIRPFTVYVNVPGVGTGQDDGNGKILGFGFEGTVDYTSGHVVVSTDAAPAAGVLITARFDVDVDKMDSLDKIQAGLISKDIRAEIWTLAADIGTFANFAFANRFGRSAEDEVAADLATAITNVMNTRAVQLIMGSAVGSSTWYKVPVSGISYAEHKLTFIDGIAAAESRMHLNAGVGTAARYLVGRNAAATLRGMPEFQKAPIDAATSIGLYGFYDGVPVIRATGIVADDDMYLIANPDGYFNSILAYAPFMPLMTTDTIQNPNNPFRGTKAAGVWAGMTSLNGNLATKLTLSPTAAPQ